MLTNTFNVEAARRGTALSVARPWAGLPGAGETPVFGQFPVQVVDVPSTRYVASRRVPPTAQPAVMAAALDIRKQNPHKTRVNAGGDGASGPHPEREPA